VDAEPMVTIGVADGDPSYVFQQVSSAHPLPDGRVVVVDGGQRLLRVFSADGTFEREMGGSGEGPEELGNIRGVWIVAPDTIRVFDGGNGRFTSYLADGSFAGGQRIQTADEGPARIPEIFAGVFDDGSVALGWISLATFRPGEVHPDRMQVGRFATDGSFKGILAEGTGFRRFMGETGSGPLPFSPYFRAVTSGDRTYVTDGSVPELAVHDLDGTRVGTLAVPSVARDVDAAWRDLEAELRRRESALWLGRMPEMPRTDSIPHISALLADDRGSLWVRAYEPLRDAVPLGARRGGGEWSILRPDGSVEAVLTLPDAADPLAIVGDRIYARHVGELDVPTLAVYRVVR
jgi:hypothetical protein